MGAAEAGGLFYPQGRCAEGADCRLDTVWCDPNADRDRITFRGFPEWLYDDDRWNEYLYHLNTDTLELAFRLLANRLGLYRARMRGDGFQVFTPPEQTYDLQRARQHLWQGQSPTPPPQEPEVAPQRPDLSLPALDWIEAMLSRLPNTTHKVLAYMPVHIAAQPRTGSADQVREIECKRRVADIGRRHSARVIDWRIASPITIRDDNYWDPLHYRLPIAHLVADELAQAALEGRPSANGHYRIVVKP